MKCQYITSIFPILFNRLAIKNVCQMLVILGTTVYQDDFERHFLKESAEFYKVITFDINLLFMF